jgi:hypothetical protein
LHTILTNSPVNRREEKNKKRKIMFGAAEGKKSFFDMDFGSITREELDNFQWNFVNNPNDDDEFEYRGSYMRHGMTASKLTQCLSKKDFQEYGKLIQMKSQYIDHWTPTHQHALEQLEEKIISTTTEERSTNRNVQSKEREMNTVEGQRVRVKSTGKFGRCAAGNSDLHSMGNPFGNGKYPIHLDRDDNDNNNDDDSSSFFQEIARDELDIICNKCNSAVADQRCGRCKKVWYCGRECQSKDWKVHKRECCIIKKCNADADVDADADADSAAGK